MTEALPVGAGRRWLGLDQPTLLVLGFAAAIAIGLLISQGRLVYYAYTPAALLVGFVLYRRYPPSFLAFALWLWMLSPFVRRVVDWQTEPSTFNLILLGPLLVSCLPALTILQVSRHLHEHRYYPFSLILLVTILGLLLGIVANGPFAAFYAFVTWLGPLAVAIYVVAQPAHGASFARSAMLSLAIGGLVVGIYGVYQFLYAPEWDTTWMIVSEMASIGNPVAGEIRVFATLNSPGPLGAFLVASFLAAMSCFQGVGTVLVLVPITASLLLSLVRSSWGALPIGLVAMIWRLPRLQRRQQLGVVVLVITTTVISVFALPQTSGILDRFDTLASLEDDTSLQVRSAFISTLIDSAFVNPIGSGLGSTGSGTRLTTDAGQLGDNGVFDSGIMDLFFTFGWGAAVIFACLVVLLRRASRLAGTNTYAAAAFGIAVATIAQMYFVNMLTSGPGMLAIPMLAIAMVQARNPGPAPSGSTR